MDDNVLDAKGLIQESYLIEEITDSQCRSIFLDWALTLPADMDTKAAIKALLNNVSPEQKNHPMTAILEQGLVQMIRPKRRGGWRSRDRS